MNVGTGKVNPRIKMYGFASIVFSMMVILSTSIDSSCDQFPFEQILQRLTV